MGVVSQGGGLNGKVVEMFERKYPSFLFPCGWVSTLQLLFAFAMGSLSAVGGSQVIAQSAAGNLEVRGVVMFSYTRKPVANLRVEVARVGQEIKISGTIIGYRPATREAVTTTDSKGQFVFKGLLAGDYELRPLLPDDPNGQLPVPPKRFDFSSAKGEIWVELWVTPMSRVAGRILGPNGEPASEFRIGLGRVVWNEGPTFDAVPGTLTAIADKEGRYALWAPAGKYYLVITRPRGTAVGQDAYYYYPGVAQLEDAVPITVRTDVSLDGIDISLDRVLVNRVEQYRVRFRLDLPQFLPGAPGRLSDYLDEKQFVTSSLAPFGRGLIKRRPYAIGLEASKGGVLLTPGLDPGDYEMMVSYSEALRVAMRAKGVVNIDWNQLNPIIRVRMTVDPREDVDNDKVLDLGTIPLRDKVSIPGRVILKGKVSEIDFSKLRFQFQDTIFGLGPIVTPGVDGTFTVKGLHAGLFRVFPPVGQWDLPAGYYVASITGNSDILTDGLLIDGGGTANPLQIVIADDGGRVEGVALRKNSAPTPDARIVLIPPANRRGALARFPTTVANVSGSFLIDRIPPGEYRLVAVDVAGRSEIRPLNAEPIRYWEAPDFVKEFEPRGERISVQSASRITLNIEALATPE